MQMNWTYSGPCHPVLFVLIQCPERFWKQYAPDHVDADGSISTHDVTCVEERIRSKHRLTADGESLTNKGANKGHATVLNTQWNYLYVPLMSSTSYSMNVIYMLLIYIADILCTVTWPCF